MALRSPLYLDTDTLLAQAEYHEIDVPQREEIVETTTKRRSGGGKFNLGAAGVDASGGSDVQRQATYSLEPREKATVSKVIDGLIGKDAVISRPDATTVLTRDALVEVEGTTRITAASLFGKMFFILRRFLEGGSLENLPDTLSATDPRLLEQIEEVYLRNELPPIPILLELEGSGLPQKVYVNVTPDHFIDVASTNRVEGEIRVLGTVSRLIDDSPDGFLSAEDWLLSGWEWMLRRTMMTRMNDALVELRQVMSNQGIVLPDEDVDAYITGPAIVVDAIALY
ncbi:hypothetical protein ABZ281_01430 [Streptomyces sp. NPDC006265]|uniref:DUF6414 family protein n=1 Tax=Streptomyces sp. NPDC006265 TaxID=3156740 RepID=UPI0033BF4D11